MEGELLRITQSSCARMRVCRLRRKRRRKVAVAEGQFEAVLGKTRRTGAAMLVVVLAGVNPAGGTCPVATVVISGGGASDQSVESPEVKASVGWDQPGQFRQGRRANRQVVAKANCS